MQLTKHTDYAFRALIYLASMKNEQATIQEIAECFKIPKSHLMKVINTLVNNGYVEASRGKYGGIRLAKDPTEIPLHVIVILMERTMEPLDCAGQECIILQTCKLKKLLEEAQSTYLTFLSHHNLGDLITPSTTKRLHLQ